MSTEPHGIARDQLRAFIERVERVEEEIASLNTDKSDIYKEARAVGFDVKVLRKVVAKRKLETHVREEQDAIFDMYWDALYGAPVHVHAHTRENIEENRRSDGGLSILTKHEDIRTTPETAEEITRPAHPAVSGGEPSIPSTDAGGVKMGGSSHPGRPDAKTSALIIAKSERATNTISQSDDGAIAEVKGSSARLANAAGVEPPSSDRQSDQPGEGGAIVVTSSAPGAGDETQTSNTGEGAANAALPAKPKVSFRPNCQHPENCASGTRDHCWSCRRAMQKSEEMA